MNLLELNDYTKLMEIINECEVVLQEKQLTLHSVSVFGSHCFGLQSHKSDLDLFVVYSQPRINYLSLDFNESVIKDKKMSFGDVHFMDIKKYIRLARKSNFTVLSSRKNILLSRLTIEFSDENFDLGTVCNHLIGLSIAKNQKVYMQAYAQTLASYIYTFKRIPETFNAFQLLYVLPELEIYDLYNRIFKSKVDGHDLHLSNDLPLVLSHNTTNVNKVFDDFPAKPFDYNNFWLSILETKL